MRILIVQDHPCRPDLGSPKSVLCLGHELRRLGHRVDFLFRDDIPSWLSHHRLSFLLFPIIAASIAVRMRRDYDVIDISSGDAWISARLARLFPGRLPVIVDRILGLEHRDWQERRSQEERGLERISPAHRVWFGIFRLWQVAQSCRYSDAVLCLSSSDRQWIVDQAWRGPETIAVVAPGVDAPTELGEGTRRRDILFVGTWQQRKGIAYLVDAFTILARERPDLRLTVAGSNTDPDVVLQDFPRSVRSRVAVLPTLTEAELVQQYRAHAVLALPSLYEGFGLVLLEAMAAATPVVGTPTGGLLDFIEPGQTGLLVPPRDGRALAAALARIIDDEVFARSLGHRARAKARRRTWHRSAVETVAAYEQALGLRGPVRAATARSIAAAQSLSGGR